jgi:hypothetical protein
MPATYEPIATTTLSSAASTITFSSISSAYTDLRFIAAIKCDASSSIRLQVNSDTGNNYSSTFLWGDGSAASSFRNTNSAYLTGSYVVSSTPLLWIFDFFSYAGSTYKTVLQTHSNDNNGSGEVARVVGLWRNTAAINRIDFLNAGGGQFASGTTVTLYGIKAA